MTKVRNHGQNSKMSIKGEVHGLIRWSSNNFSSTIFLDPPCLEIWLTTHVTYPSISHLILAPSSLSQAHHVSYPAVERYLESSTAGSWALDKRRCWTQRIRFASLFHLQRWFLSVCSNSHSRLLDKNFDQVKSILDPFLRTTYMPLLTLVGPHRLVEELKVSSTTNTVGH